MSIEQTAELRRSGIGGSDAGVILGYSRWKTPLQLYYEKIGQSDPVEESEPMLWGKILEAVVAKEYARRTGNKVARVNDTIRAKDAPFMMAHIDRRVLNVDGGMVLEVKTAGKWWNPEEWGEDGSADVPAQYYAQVQHYLMVTGWARADLAVLLAGQEMRIYHLDRDEEFIKKLDFYESSFWALVLDKTPPDPTEPEDAVRRWPQDDGQTIVADDTALKDIGTFRQVKGEIDRLEGLADQVKLRLQKTLGGRTALVTAKGDSLATWKTQQSTRLDATAFKAAHPDIYQQFAKSSPSRVFRLGKAAEKVSNAGF